MRTNKKREMKYAVKGEYKGRKKLKYKNPY